MSCFYQNGTHLVHTDESNTFLKERIEREMREQKGMELPGFLSYMTCKNVIQRLLDGYIPPARDCLHKINCVVEEFLRKVVEEKFAGYPELLLQVQVRRHRPGRVCFR